MATEVTTADKWHIPKFNTWLQMRNAVELTTRIQKA
jgi:hypothetical protein